MHQHPMKTLFAWTTLALFLGCGSPPSSPEPIQLAKVVRPDTAFAVIVVKSGTGSPADSIDISPWPEESWKYPKKQLDSILADNPELNPKEAVDPDLIYNLCSHPQRFGSEVGQDEFYMIYAWSLGKKHPGEAYRRQRANLTAIYSTINRLFDDFEYGGTYFGHQSRRIPAYAEFVLTGEAYDSKHSDKSYDIGPQKKLYITSLRRLIEDESSIDNNTLGKEKLARKRTLNKVVDQLDALITDIFYLRRAQAFQYNYYNYY